MKVTLTIEHNDGRSTQVSRERLPGETTDGEDLTDERQLDTLLVYLDADARRAAELPNHYKNALLFLVGLPDRKSELIDKWEQPGWPRSLSEFVRDVQPYLPPGSITGKPVEVAS